MPTVPALEPKPYHHGDLREAVLARAAEIVGEQGIEALSLRAIARDLGVSHGAPNRHFRNKAELLATLATDAWYAARSAVLSAAEQTASGDPHVRLNAMGRGYLRWALANPAQFAALQHPDVARYADGALGQAQQEYEQLIYDVVVETQADGRHPEVDPNLLALYTFSVPFGVAGLLQTARVMSRAKDLDREELIAGVIELVVPIRDRALAESR
jgi:AcrR family transcriptional regulator